MREMNRRDDGGATSGDGRCLGSSSRDGSRCGSSGTRPLSRTSALAVIAVGWRLLTVPFCRGFAGIEAFNAFMAVKSQYFLFSTGTDNPFERGVPDNNV